MYTIQLVTDDQLQISMNEPDTEGLFDQIRQARRFNWKAPLD